MEVDKLISRATHTTGRTLLIVASIVILSNCYEHPLEKFPILVTAKDVPPGMVSTTAIGMLVFLWLVHLINWANDFFSYRSSTIRKIIIDDVTERFGPIINKRDEHETYKRFVEEYKNTIKASEWTQWFSLWIQHLITPLVVGLIALIWACRSYPSSW